ncbi:MAG TPA: hypothetical protein PKC76_02070 [Saprospiraceae bacterium]|nr:hypothetical protein [Saprospiraceae bacterium]HMP22884.1 hypothetical protein [Saprospiraceae bacterium]
MKNLQAFSSWFYQKANLVWMFLFMGLAALFNALILPAMADKLATVPPLTVLDLRFGFTPEEAWQLLDALGEAGRAQYQQIELTLDVLYPLIYTGFLVFLLSLLYKKTLRPDSLWRLLNLLPFVVLIADFIENAGIVQLIRRFPERADAIAGWTSVANQVKWTMFMMTIGVVLVGLMRLLLVRFRK